MAALLALGLSGLSAPPATAEPGPDDTLLAVAADPATLGGIPDPPPGCGTPGAPRDILFNVPSRPQRIVDVEVSLTLTHTWLGDLRVELLGPGGTPAFPVLGATGSTTATGCGDSSNLDGTYTFADGAAGDWWAAAAAIPGAEVVAPGAFRSSEPGGSPGSTGAATMMTPPFADTAVEDVWTLRITDSGGGDVGAVSAASLHLTLDTTAPETVVTGPAVPRKYKRPLYELTSPDPDVAGFWCKVDRSPWGECTSPFRPQVRQGRHTVRIAAFDTSTNVDSTPEVRRFTYETKRCAKAKKAFKKAKKALKRAKASGNKRAVQKAKKKFKKAKRAKRNRCR